MERNKLCYFSFLASSDEMKITMIKETKATDTICLYGIPRYRFDIDDFNDLHIWAWHERGKDGIHFQV